MEGLVWDVSKGLQGVEIQKQTLNEFTEICSGIPEDFGILLKYAKSLRFEA